MNLRLKQWILETSTHVAISVTTELFNGQSIFFSFLVKKNVKSAMDRS